ncbi:MAG: hypothetical protein AAFV29_02085, partial [Myxococcota bacterium]
MTSTSNEPVLFPKKQAVRRLEDEAAFLKPIAIFAPEDWRTPLTTTLDGLPHAKRWFGQSLTLQQDVLRSGSAIVVSDEVLIRRLRARSWYQPIMAIVPSEASTQTMIRMYEAGASVVLAWPEEVPML